MDLETYIGRYTGENRLRRLLHIIDSTSSSSSSNNNNDNNDTTTTVQQQAFTIAEQYMKQDCNIVRYKELFGVASNTTTASTVSQGTFEME